jgi:hypothetical protein
MNKSEYAELIRYYESVISAQRDCLKAREDLINKVIEENLDLRQRNPEAYMTKRRAKA